MLDFWRRRDDIRREEAQNSKLDFSHKAMHLAMTTTTDAADNLIDVLRHQQNLPDNDDALLLCDPKGIVTRCNIAAIRLFASDISNFTIGKWLSFDTGDFETRWTSLTNNPPTERTPMRCLSSSGAFPVEVLVTRLADTLCLLVDVRKMTS